MANLAPDWQAKKKTKLITEAEYSELVLSPLLAIGDVSLAETAAEQSLHVSDRKSVNKHGLTMTTNEDKRT